MGEPATPLIAEPDDPLCVAQRRFSSRLLVGTGKYRDLEQSGQAVTASGAEIVTLAIRRANIGQNPDEPNLLDAVRPIDSRCCPIQPAAIPRTKPCVPADSPANFWTATTW